MKSYKVLPVLLLTFSLVFLVTVSALAAPLSFQDQPPDEIPPLLAVLTKLASGVGVGVVVSFLFERFTWFGGLTGDARWGVIFGVSVGLPVIAQLLVQFVPTDVWAALQPYWHSLAAGFLGWAGGQALHLGRKALAK